MPWRVLAFALGIWLLQQSAVLPAPIFLGGGALAGMLLLLAGWRRYALLSMMGAALLGFAWAGFLAQLRLDDALPAAWEGRDIDVTGVVAGLPQRFERGIRFVIDVEQAQAPVPGRIALSWYRHVPPAVDEEGDEEAAPGALHFPRAGERWRLLVRLKRPHGNLNPHGFDVESWLFERGIRATGYVKKSALAGWQGEPQNVRLAVDAGQPVDRLRESLRSRIAGALPEAPYAGIVAALAMGDQQAIAPELWRLFAATGITHLMSISGLHVTMIGALVAWLVNLLWRRSEKLPLRWPAQKAAVLAGFGGALAYALIAGFGVPAQRTLYMLGIVVLALLSGRSLAAANVLGLALLLVLLIDPWAVQAAGFWLSFGAVALLFYIASGRIARPHWLAEWGRAQWAMTLGLIPALLALFQQFSLVSPVANALAIPLVSLLVTPLALLGSLPGFSWALGLAHALLVPLMDFLAWLASLPGALWQQHAPTMWSVPLALLGTLWLLLPRGFPNRWLGLLLFLPLFMIVPARPGPGELKVVVLDVGQGQAVHLQTATHDLVFDTGPDFGSAGNSGSSGSDAGSRIITPYLRAAGVRKLDSLIVSHADRDHAGGADSLLAAMPVTIMNRRCVDGQGWEWDGVRFRVLHPADADYQRKVPSNALSCVLKIESGHGSVLIPADVEERAEQELLARHGAALRADVLVAPHHGGKKTASPEFVTAVGAQTVIFPVGYRNRFGHPWPAVAERFSAAGADLHRTDHDGAVTLLLGQDGMQIAHERERRRRYWHNVPIETAGKSP